MRPFIFFLVSSLALAGCSRRKTIDRNEARSEIRSALSFAAESEIFIDFVRRGQATRQYAEGHAAYLEDAVKRSAKELEQEVPEPGTEKAVRECRTQLNSLARELSQVPAAIKEDDALAASRDRIAEVRKALEAAQTGL